ncbi:MAG: N-6 DNA methylase [Rhodanobacteraceae bacterium]
MTQPDPRRELVKLLQANAYRVALWDVFRDFLEIAAIAMANAIDLRQKPEREERYLAIVSRYKPEEQQRFPQMFGALVAAMEEEPGDIIGTILGELELGNTARGQFFTPYSICKLMAQITVGDGGQIRQEVERKGFVTINEPAVGGGAMVIAFAESMREAGFNPQQQLYVVAQDVDPRAVHMSYVQLSLLNIPALVVLGNTLAFEESEHWYTPAHFLGLWRNKLRRGYALGSAMDGAEEPAVEAMPAAPDVTLPASGDWSQADMFLVEREAA